MKQLNLFETKDVVKFRRKQTQQYDEFTAKFNHTTKKTTDDCYTPPEVYNCVKDYFLEQFPDWKDRPIVRPFCPGGDFERFDYPDNCVVIDNPPFSISAKIVRWYIDHDIQFALFAPHLMCVVRDTDITYYIAGAIKKHEKSGEVKISAFFLVSTDVFRFAHIFSVLFRIASTWGHSVPFHTLSVSLCNAFDDRAGVSLRLVEVLQPLTKESPLGEWRAFDIRNLLASVVPQPLQLGNKGVVVIVAHLERDVLSA